MVAVPLAVLGWLGARLQTAELAATDDLIDKLLGEEIKGYSQTITGVMEQYQRDVAAKLDTSSLDPAQLRELLQHSPLVTQYFVVDRQGAPRYPVYESNGNSTEQEFLVRTREIWMNGELTTQSAPEQASPPATRSVGKVGVQNVAPSQRTSGWYVWHWGSDIHILLWTRRDDGVVVGAEISRPRLIADVIAALSQSVAAQAEFPTKRVELRNSRGDVVYSNSNFGTDDATHLRVALALEYPLNTWSLACFVNQDELAQAYDSEPYFWYRISTQLGALAIALIALAIYLYRENMRSMREAAQRVSFVNQVSHELKTPLTNIRMYAEMLEENLDHADDQSKRHVGVLVSESQRLSRLIANILTFSRKERHALKLRPAPGSVDTCVRSVLDHFKPALDAHGVSVTANFCAEAPAIIDADAIGQIVGNLVSNVEKYAATGKELTITTSQTGDSVTITVADAGPGIPPKERVRVFNAFYRVSDKLTDGVAGTGIGLTIARELARLHGGDLTLQPSERGACFQVTLNCPRAGVSP